MSPRCLLRRALKWQLPLVLQQPLSAGPLHHRCSSGRGQADGSGPAATRDFECLGQVTLSPLGLVQRGSEEVTLHPLA